MEATLLETPEIMESQNTEKVVHEKKKSLWDYVMENRNKPSRYTINKEDEDLIFGSNMWVKLMQEEVLDEE